MTATTRKTHRVGVQIENEPDSGNAPHEFRTRRRKLGRYGPSIECARLCVKNSKYKCYYACEYDHHDYAQRFGRCVRKGWNCFAGLDPTIRWHLLTLINELTSVSGNFPNIAETVGVCKHRPNDVEMLQVGRWLRGVESYYNRPSLSC